MRRCGVGHGMEMDPQWSGRWRQRLAVALTALLALSGLVLLLLAPSLQGAVWSVALTLVGAGAALVGAGLLIARSASGAARSDPSSGAM